MTKAEWDAMEARKRDGLVLTALWKAENGKPIGIKWHGDDEIFYGEYIPSGKPWKTHSIDAVHVPRFTTDRNACALVLDEIGKLGNVFEFMGALIPLCPSAEHALSCPPDRRERLWGWWVLLNAAPDTICYAALKAVEDEP